MIDDARMKKITSLFAMMGRGTDGEKTNAAHALMRVLANIDVYELIERLQNPALNPDEMQRLHDQGYEKGYIVGSEQGRRSSPVTTRPVRASAVLNVDGSGVNGYPWSQIVEHCFANRHVFRRPRDLEFVESLKEQFDTYRTRPSPEQAAWLRDLFMRKFNGRIK